MKGGRNAAGAYLDSLVAAQVEVPVARMSHVPLDESSGKRVAIVVAVSFGREDTDVVALRGNDDRELDSMGQRLAVFLAERRPNVANVLDLLKDLSQRSRTDYLTTYLLLENVLELTL